MPNNPNFTILTADRLIDSTGGLPIEDGAILLQGDRIVAVGRAADVRAPDGAAAHTKRYAGCTIMPGMVDCHTHHNGFGDGRLGDDLALLPDEILTVQSARNARASLYSGVTTIRENGPQEPDHVQAAGCHQCGACYRPAHGALRASRRHYRRAYGLLRRRSYRRERGARAHTPAHKGRRGLHQDCRHRRHYAPHRSPRWRRSMWTNSAP